MQVGGGGSLRSDINVIPLVDVVLVLLVIFLVITPVVQMGYLVKVPPLQFPHRLREILHGNTSKIVFFQGSPDVDYETTMSFLDLARSSGAKNIGIIVEAAQ